jgi:hypothetical protein
MNKEIKQRLASVIGLSYYKILFANDIEKLEKKKSKI